MEGLDPRVLVEALDWKKVGRATYCSCLAVPRQPRLHWKCRRLSSLTDRAFRRYGRALYKCLTKLGSAGF
ncbi:hypothetical protein [Burkholderia cepacia]|uniref:hypothetical protein n=1 Tax=Burkholderia cepacia TaxID=292 RepID=UPI000A53F896|nr:hypothetical protein [Burkholderia cepacia]